MGQQEAGRRGFPQSWGPIIPKNSYSASCGSSYSVPKTPTHQQARVHLPMTDMGRVPLTLTLPLQARPHFSPGPPLAQGYCGSVFPCTVRLASHRGKALQVSNLESQ